MNNDASPAASSPMINGIGPSEHREADASIKDQDQDQEAPHGSSSSLRQTCAELHTRVKRFLEVESVDEVIRSTQEQVRISVQVIEKALNDYKFEELSLSYNGGKDCLVLLILYLSVLHTHFTQPNGRRKAKEEEQAHRTNSTSIDQQQQQNYFPDKIPSIYAKPPDPFPQVTSFVDSSSQEYNLDLTHMATNPGTQPSITKARSHVDPPDPTAPARDDATTTDSRPIVSFRDAFTLYLSSHPTVRAIFVGTRRTDPHGKHLTHFDITDGNWPRFMRIHPVIDWKLSEIWCFLKSECLRDSRTGEPLSYCHMYDEGYTSLGGIEDTLRNPKLRYIDENGVERFRPAYEMTEDLGERLGRE